jgi:hypothetical protein
MDQLTIIGPPKPPNSNQSPPTEHFHLSLFHYLRSLTTRQMSSSITFNTARSTTHGSKFIEVIVFTDIPFIHSPRIQMFSSDSDISPPTKATSSRTRAAPAWSPLTQDEARALIQSKLFPGHAPPFVLSEERRNMPQAEINRLAGKIGRENTLRRTHNYVREVTPNTPDQRILRTFRRKSYTAPSNHAALVVCECCSDSI